MSWTEERIQELGRLWQAGHSASEIGKQLGVSKNAVVGKAHRLKLPARPSPIKAVAETARPTPPPTPKQHNVQSAPSAQSVPPRQTAQSPRQHRSPAPAQPSNAANSHAGPVVTGHQARQPKQEGRTAVAGVAQSRRAVPARAKPEPRTRGPGCLWPIGDPGDADFHFCGAASVPGKPYCAEHAARAYITRSRDRDEEAA